MTFEEIRNIKDEATQVDEIYKIYNEDKRLNRSKAARVEFFTTVYHIEKYLKEGHRILDIGAGCGEYSLYFAGKGYRVDAIELSENNVRVFREKITPELPITLSHGNALDLSHYENESFDVVLLFGPLYHLHRPEDRRTAIREALRVLKREGKLFVSFISNDFVVLTELSNDPTYLLTGNYDKSSFKLEDFPFVFFTLDVCREMLAGGGAVIEGEIASDGISELMADRINELDEESYTQYLRYHAYISEKKEFLGMSSHLLFICRKDTEK